MMSCFENLVVARITCVRDPMISLTGRLHNLVDLGSGIKLPDRIQDVNLNLKFG